MLLLKIYIFLYFNIKIYLYKKNIKIYSYISIKKLKTICNL